MLQYDTGMQENYMRLANEQNIGVLNKKNKNGWKKQLRSINKIKYHWMRAGKLLKNSYQHRGLLKTSTWITHLRFLTILILQYFSNANQELLVALLRVPTYDRN